MSPPLHAQTAEISAQQLEEFRAAVARGEAEKRLLEQELRDRRKAKDEDDKNYEAFLSEYMGNNVGLTKEVIMAKEVRSATVDRHSQTCGICDFCAASPASPHRRAPSPSPLRRAPSLWLTARARREESGAAA